MDTKNTKRFDLDERTFKFAKNCRDFCYILSKTIANIEDCKQLIRSSGSVAANYIEASESLSKKDFIMRIKICRKEAKESCLWLRLCNVATKSEALSKRDALIQESIELTKIFGSILEKCK